MNINSEFSPKKGFFREADKGGGGGVTGGDESGSSSNNEQTDAKGATMKTEKEILDNVLPILGADIKKTAQLIDDLEAEAAIEVLEQSRDLAMWYKTSSPKETAALAFLKKKLEEKAAELGYSFEDELEESEGSVGGAESVESAEDGERPSWQTKFDRLWDELQDTYRERASSNPDIRDLTSQLTEIVEEHFSEEEKRAYRRTLLMRDVANPNAVFRHLCTETPEEARKKSYLNEAHELRKYMDLENVFGVSIKEIVDYLETDAFDNIEHKITRGDGSIGVFHWDYAANGDPEEELYAPREDDGTIDFSGFPNEGDVIPDEEWKGKKALTLQELIENKFPKLKEIPKFVSDSLITFVIVSELRYHKFYPYYNYYQNSPINGMDAGALLPWGIPGYLGYKAASIQKIPGYSSILMLTRHPNEEKLKEVNDFEGTDEEIEDSINAEYRTINFEEDWARGRFIFKKNDNGVVERNHGRRIREHEYVENRNESFEGDSLYDKTSKKKRFDKALENREIMVMVRNALCWMFSPDVDFGSVTLNPDMQLLPSPWNVIKGKWRGESINITLDDLFEVYDQFNKFAEEIDNVPSITQPMQAMTLLSDLISNTSRFKVIFGKLNKPVFQELYDLVGLMYMFYLKKLFDQYMKLPKMKGLSYATTPKHMVFAQEVIHEVEFDRTLPPFIKETIVKAMNQLGVVADGKWGVIFSPPTAEDETPLFIRFQQLVGSGFAQNLNRWLKPARPEEKDPNQ